MTTIKDPIRQASLFTMNGLIDPRLMPVHDETTLERKFLDRPEMRMITLRSVVENILRRKVGFQ